MKCLLVLMNGEEEKFDKEENLSGGVCYCFDVKENKTEDYGILLVFSNAFLNPKDYSFAELVGTLVHESLHIINKLFLAIGQKWDMKNDEIEAYIQGYIAEQIINYLLEENFIQRWKIKNI